MENTPRTSTACPFCRPETSDGHNRVLRENALAYATLSNPRKMPGHTLVVPKRHVEKPWEMTGEELAAVFALIGTIEQKILEHLAPGCDVRQHYMPFVPEGRLKVDHVHYHLMPRAPEDAFWQHTHEGENSLFEVLTPEEEDKIRTIFE